MNELTYSECTAGRPEDQVRTYCHADQLCLGVDTDLRAHN